MTAAPPPPAASDAAQRLAQMQTNADFAHAHKLTVWAMELDRQIEQLKDAAQARKIQAKGDGNGLYPK